MGPCLRERELNGKDVVHVWEALEMALLTWQEIRAGYRIHFDRA
jgi:hypothetical protein